MLESPYSGDVERNVEYALECMRDSLSRGEAPMATHLLYTQIPGGFLCDTKPHAQRMTDRATGLAGGLAWRKLASKTVMYVDLGVSAGMDQARLEAESLNQVIEVRRIRE